MTVLCVVDSLDLEVKSKQTGRFFLLQVQPEHKRKMKQEDIKSKTASDELSDGLPASPFENLDNILHWQLKEGLWYNPELIAELFLSFPISDETRALLIHASDNAALNLECMECILSMLSPSQKAIGIVTGHNLATSLLVGFFVNMHNPKIPVRVFKNKELAQVWLKGMTAEQ